VLLPGSRSSTRAVSAYNLRTCERRTISLLCHGMTSEAITGRVWLMFDPKSRKCESMLPCLLSTDILQTLQLTFETPTQMWGSKQTKLVICNISLFSGVRLQAFASPDALGVIAVSDVPYLKERRGRLLPLAARLAHLDEDILERYTRPECNYSIGWSRGQECMKPGQRDSLKGSFYANPLRDYCTDDDAMQTHSSANPMTYCNIIFLGCYIKMTCSCRQSRS
jgi:hypothetical protein